MSSIIHALIPANTSPAAITLSTHPARMKIKHLDLEPIKFKLVKEAGWTLEKADRVEALYKGFLFLNAAMPGENHVPTEEIDDMWHAHILDTSKYMADCHVIFGTYLHHFPYMGLRGADDKAHADQSFSATRTRMIEMLGLDPLSGDKIDAADCGGGGGCSSSSCSSSSCSSGNTGGHSDPAPGGNDNGGHKSSCSSYIPFNDSSNPNTDRKKKPKDVPEKKREREERKPLWQRILGLSGESNAESWDASVSPQNRMARAARPGRDELLMATDETPDGVTRH